MPASSNFILAQEEYEKAYRKGKREVLPCLVLDDILKDKQIQAPKEMSLGLVQIPVEQLVGTKTSGRSSAFSKSFYPLIASPSEFSSKWISLYMSHLDEGIRDPIKAYEFMNQYFVVEGNKRVSVLKYSGAVSIPAYVTRLIPPWSDDKETRIYYEYMDFYNYSKINYIWFHQEGSFAKLQQLVGKRPDEMWTDDDRLIFSSVYHRFESAYYSYSVEKRLVSVGDAFLFFISLYDYATLDDMPVSQLKDLVHKARHEFKLLIDKENAMELQLDHVSKTSKKGLLSRLLSSNPQKLSVAFIHTGSKATSSWTYSHELGRMYLEDTFGDQLQTTCYNDVTEENAEAIINQAIEDGNRLIFTTSPALHKASLRSALSYPDIKILNCSLNKASRNMRTYYARMYEAKFLMGAIAGCMSQSGNIGYIADYPLFGIIANINAFALGAKMVNPRAKIYLEWSTLKDHDYTQTFTDNNVAVISGQDMLIPGTSSRKFGLYRREGNNIMNLAVPVWHWGKFYEKLIQNILSGNWKNDESDSLSKGLNYWWGMSAEIIDIIYSHHLPIGSARLIDLLKKNICEYGYNPFTGVLFSQDGMIQDSPDKCLTPEEIVKMDWLAENVHGRIPKMDELIDKAKPIIQNQGIDHAKN